MSTARLDTGAAPVRTSTPPARLSLLLAGLFGALAWLAWPSGSGTPPLPAAPILREPVASCDGPVEEARQRARRAAAGAEGAILRYPFAAAEGPRALALLAEASACQTRAGEKVAAERIDARRERWLTRLRADYRDYRLRLSRALAAGDEVRALRALRAIEALLPAERAAYRDALARLALELEDRASEGQR